MLETSGISGTLSALILEGFKWIIRKFIVHNDTYEIPAWFYLVAYPVLNTTLIPLMAFVYPNQYSMPVNEIDYIRSVLQILFSSLATVVVYNLGIKPLKEYQKRLDSLKSS